MPLSYNKKWSKYKASSALWKNSRTIKNQSYTRYKTKKIIYYIIFTFYFSHCYSPPENRYYDQ